MRRSGRLRHFVTFESLQVTPDSDGAQEEAWEPEFNGALIAASIEPLSGRELLNAAAVNSKTATRISVRYLPGIDPTWRIRHRSTVYNIESVIPDDGSGTDHITFMCSSGVNDG